MPNWRDTVRAARARVHQTMRVRAVYVLRSGTVGTSVWVRIRFRHIESGLDDAGARLNDAEETVMFDMAEVAAPMVNAFVLVDATEAYVIRASDPPRLGYVQATVTRVSAAQAATLWSTGVPEDHSE